MSETPNTPTPTPDNVVHIPQIDPDDFTRFDEALAEQLKVMEKAGALHRMMDIFIKFGPQLSDRGYWYILGVLWARHPDLDRLEDWVKLFTVQRPKRALYLMTEGEMSVVESFQEAEHLEAFRPMVESGGLNPFIYCTNKETADRHARMFGAEKVGRFVVPRDAVVAFFQRLRGPELLVIDQRGVTREGELPLDPMKKKSRRKKL